MNEIIKASEHAMTEAEFKPLLDGFMEKVNKKPNPSAIQRNPYSNNAQYIPIGILENALDSLFMGLWKTDNLNYSIELNSVICTIDLHFYHPITKQWLTRSGAGAVPVELDKETKQLNTKALHKNFPAAKAFAFRNAVQSIGDRFGRSLNRKEKYSYKADTHNYSNILADEKDV